MEIVLATANRDKVQEIREILPDSGIRFLTMEDIDYYEPIAETGETFAENALIKARAVHARSGGYVLADDSGLAVDLLNGAPGIYSARFAGEDADYPQKIARLQAMLAGYPQDKWHASFICVMALIRPDKSEITVTGQCRGLITSRPRGDNGFGYDPVFYLPELGKTMAELDPEHKHTVSHRGKALRQIAKILRRETQLLDQSLS